MPPSATSRIRFSTEPQRALLTPSASPSVGPPDRPSAKRPRLRSTPSSSISATPSTSNESNSSADFNSARRASTLRVLNVWAQLAERYNKRLDEDDILDLYSGAIIKDRGVVRGASRDYHIGHFGQPDDEQDHPDADQDQEDSEQDDDDGELGTLPPSETVTDDDAPISKTELLRGVPPLSATTDAEDLKEFLEAEKRRRELAGDEEEEDDMSPERLAALRKALRDRAQEKEAANAERAQEASSAENPQEGDVDATPTRPTRVQQSDDESEDELSAWKHDESTAVHPVARDESQQDVQEVAREIIELTDAETDSDEEFEALLMHPPSFTSASPVPVPQPKKDAHKLLQSPPDSERGRSKSRACSLSRKPSAVETTKSENRPRSPVVLRKPEVILMQKRKTSLAKKPDTPISEEEISDQEVASRTSSMRKGKGKEVSPSPPVDTKKMAKPHGVVSRGRKRKRISSSSASGNQLPQSPGGHSATASVRMSKLASPNLHTAEPTLSIFPSPNQRIPATPQPSHPPGLPPPLDPAQAQQAHYLLAQAMHHLSYLLSTTMPSYSPYTPNSNQPWHPPPLPPHTTYSTPVHPRPYHTPSSGISRPGLPPSSPVRSSVSPPLEAQRARSRGRSKSRRVSFKLDREEVRLESPTSPPREVARGRTPGPPNRKKPDAPRGRSLSRR